jgi:hypothetical protein
MKIHLSGGGYLATLGFQLSNYQQSQVNARLVYENAVKICNKANVPAVASKLTQSFLRLEQLMVLGKTQFQFPILVNNNGPANTLFNTEQRLNQQDSIICSAWGFFFAVPLSGTDPTMTLLSYPSPQVPFFSLAGAAIAAQTVYNSIFNIAVNNTIILPAWDLFRHYFVPQTQNKVGVTAQTIFPIDQLDGSGDGFFPVEPNLVWIGSQNIVINLIMPAAFATLQTGGFSRMVIYFRGLLAQNSTIIT